MTNQNFFVDIKALHPEVTGSLISCSVRLPNQQNIKFIVDAGLFQEEQYSSLNQALEINPSEIDFALITHTHIDHVGRLPMLVKNGFKGNIYMSEVADILVRPALENTLQIFNQDTLNSQKPKVAPLFDSEDLENTLSMIHPVKFYETFSIHKNIRCVFYKNPHILGAAIIELNIHYPKCEPIRLIFTGDYSKKNTFFTTRKLPKSLLNSNVTIIQESTYGSTQTLEVEKTFDSSICSAANKGYSIVIPVFAFERAQLVMLKLKELQNSMLLDKKIPIYLDGELAIKYTGIYQKLKFMFYKNAREFFPENFKFVTSQEMRLSLMNMHEKKILLTTSGMGGWGPAKLYLPYFAQKKNCLIQFPGYVSECSLGKKLIDAKLGDEITLCDGKKITKKCIVKQTSEFSSHAKADELIEFDNNFSKIQALLINHGPKAAQASFKSKAEEETNAKSVSIMERNLIFRIGPYGIVKTFFQTN